MQLAAVMLAALAGWCLPASELRRLRRVMTPRQGAPAPPRRSALGWFRGDRVGARWVSRRTVQRRRGEVVELCQALSSELQAGATPRDALGAAARGVPQFAQLTTVASSAYGDVPAALSAAAGSAGCEGLDRVAACWRLCERSGIGLAAAVARVADSLRDDEQVRRETAAQVAGPRATGVLLALLPLFGLALGNALGAAPLRLLLHTPVGLVLLASAAGLEILGLIWMGRITRRVLPP